MKKRGKYYYGDNQADIRTEIARYSKRNTYVATAFADAVCACGGRLFALLLDDEAGVAVRRCVACSASHPMADGAEFLEDATLEECACPCEAERFELTVGVALYAESQAVRWLYVGCRCPACGLVAVYGDWKNEHDDAAALLAMV